VDNQAGIQTGLTYIDTQIFENSALLKYGITSYYYSGPLQSAYTACFGSELGEKVGKKIETVPHRTLGGDSNYKLSNYNKNKSLRETALKNNFENKYPSRFLGQKTYIEFGNHERGIEGKKSGGTNEVMTILEAYNPNKNINYLTYIQQDSTTPCATC